jgi:hypothetical protein
MQITDMTTAIETLIEAIKTDYLDCTERSAIARGKRSVIIDGTASELNDINKRMIADFNASMRVEEGRKYIKIIKDTSVWGFVVKEDGGKFKRGDILKAASWASPATNHARGNVFDGYRIQWTGPYYI